MIEIVSNKGGVVHTVGNWDEVPALAEHIETLRPKYFTEASFPRVARVKGLSFDVVIIEGEEKPEEGELGEPGD